MFALDPDEKLSRFFIIPEARIYAQGGTAPRLDIGIGVDWRMRDDSPAGRRYQSSVLGLSTLIIQKGAPTITRVEQVIKSRDLEARGFLPIEQGALVRIDYSARGDDNWAVTGRTGDTIYLNHRRFNSEQWFFANWRLGSGIFEIDLGLTQIKNRDFETRSDSTEVKPLEHMLSPYKTRGLWRVKYTIQR